MYDLVDNAIRQVAAAEVSPRFRRLTDADVEEKSAGEIVTAADRACEALLTDRLRTIRDIPVIGEESSAADPDLVDGIDRSEAVWIVDPLDGTSNFVAGSTDHAIMVALVEGSLTVAAWMYHPPSGVMAHAVAGGGAWIDEQPVIARPPRRDLPELRGTLKKRFLPEPTRERIASGPAVLTSATEGHFCAGIDYPALVLGASDYILYWRTLPWDHAPGVLFAEESGLRAGRPDGRSYQPGDPSEGLLISHPVVWNELQELIFGTGG